MKHKRKYISAVIILLLLFILGITVKLLINKNKDTTHQSIKEEFSSLLKTCGEYLTFDNYTVTLEKNYYNKATGDACCLFSIKNNTVDVIEHQISCDEQLGTFSIFELGSEHTDYVTGSVSGNGSIDIEYEIVNNIVNVYMHLNMLPDKENLYIYFMEESLLFKQDSDNVELPRFVLNETTDSLNFKAEDVEIFVSEAGVVLDDTTDVKELKLIDKNDKEICIVKDSVLSDGFGKSSNQEIDKYIFKDLIDTEEIKCLTINGQTYYPANIEKKATTDQLYDEEGYDDIFSNESSYLKKTIYTKFNEETNTVDITFTTTWTKPPKERNMDLICLDWKLMGYNEDSLCKVTHKVYETCTEYEKNLFSFGDDKKLGTTGRWIVNECERADSEQGLYSLLSHSGGKPISVKSDTYDIAPGGMYIFTSLYNDYDYCPESKINSIPLSGNYYHYSYTNETIIVNLVLNLSDYKFVNDRFNCNYYHCYGQKEHDYSVIVSGDLTITDNNVSFDKVGIYTGVADEINKLDTSKTIKTSLKGERAGYMFNYEINRK